MAWRRGTVASPIGAPLCAPTHPCRQCRRGLPRCCEAVSVGFGPPPPPYPCWPCLRERMKIPRSVAARTVCTGCVWRRRWLSKPYHLLRRRRGGVGGWRPSSHTAAAAADTSLDTCKVIFDTDCVCMEGCLWVILNESGVIGSLLTRGVSGTPCSCNSAE